MTIQRLVYYPPCSDERRDLAREVLDLDRIDDEGFQLLRALANALQWSEGSHALARAQMAAVVEHMDQVFKESGDA